MRRFVIFSLIAVAYGRPDVSLGYNYNVGHSGSGGAGSNLNGDVLPAPNNINRKNSNGLGLQPAGSSSNPLINTNPAVQQGSREEPLINKQFFLHSAPEDTQVEHKHFILGRPQKNYRVVFIKAPSSTNSKVRLSAEYAPAEEKTHIFVLSQKDAELSVNDIATPAPTQPSKPEVFFVKYRTPEEAKHAQQKIQDQYDALGGTSQVSDEGIAPVSSVVGALGNNDELAPSSSNQQGVKTGSTGNYLPPRTSYLPSARF